jgi:holo-[acyl-carrier protein] synthase
MILGVGLDIVEIDRFKRLVENTVFLSRVFSCDEQVYIRSKGRAAAATAAGIFCAKEALSKALGCGLTGNLLRETEVVHDRRGSPGLVLSGELGMRCAGNVFHLSITHSDLVASAVVIYEKP